jgi:CheY-like chemotaxis protein
MVKALAGPSTPSLQGVRVLIVDDDAEFLDLSAMALRRAGAEVRTASSAARAQELIEFWKPKVLLTDLAMPGEDGFMLVDTMRTSVSKERMDLAIIAMTAYGTSETRARAVRAGFDLYLTKPIDPVGLAVAVAGVVRRPT